jgi:hypothetical protein
VTTSSSPDPGAHLLPDWALGQATNELDDEDSPSAIDKRAWELVHDFENERHNRDDDPDQGGEA